MSDPRPAQHIVSAIIRRDDEIVMIRQGGFW